MSIQRYLTEQLADLCLLVKHLFDGKKCVRFSGWNVFTGMEAFIAEKSPLKDKFAKCCAIPKSSCIF